MSAEVIALLRSIDASLKQLLKGAPAAGGEVATDRDLDGTYGDPILKFMPRDWTGDSYKGQPFSSCPPDLLDLVADTFEYFARKAEETNELTSAGKPVAPYKRKDAARARGWAKRMRAGTHKPSPGPSDATSYDWAASDSDIPFMWFLPLLMSGWTLS